MTLFFKLCVCFIVMTVIGTLSHEFGHYLAAVSLGEKANLHHGSTNWGDKDSTQFLNNTLRKYHSEIYNHLDFPEKDKYYRISLRMHRKSIWITLAGPFQTMLFGSVGLILLIIYRKKLILTDRVSHLGWFILFLTLLWLRQLANLGVTLFSYFRQGNIIPRGDEMRLAIRMNLPLWSLQIITGIIAAGVLAYVLTVIPKPQKLPFILSGLVGGSLGYYLWLIKFGPLILP